MYEFRYDYVKPKPGEKAELGSMDTGNFIVQKKQQTFIQILQNC